MFNRFCLKISENTQTPPNAHLCVFFNMQQENRKPSYTEIISDSPRVNQRLCIQNTQVPVRQR